MSTALAVRDESMGMITPQEWQMMTQQAGMLVKTGFLPQAIKTPEQAIAIMMTGRELGVPTMAALRSIVIIQGTPSISQQLMLALIETCGELESREITDDGEQAIVTMKRKGHKAHTETFSAKDADAFQTTEGYGENKRSISLSQKFNWKSQPKTMRKWRAVAACARIVFPDVILGLYTPDELGSDSVITEDGAVIASDPKTPVRNVTPIQPQFKQADKQAAFNAQKPTEPVIEAEPIEQPEPAHIPGETNENPDEEEPNRAFVDGEPMTAPQRKMIWAVGEFLFGKDGKDKEVHELLWELGRVQSVEHLGKKGASLLIEKLQEMKNAKADA